jgi:hypothetical protein
MAVFWAIALMTEAVQTPETLVNSYQSTQRYNPEDSRLQSHCHGNLKSNLPFLSQGKYAKNESG